MRLTDYPCEGPFTLSITIININENFFFEPRLGDDNMSVFRLRSISTTLTFMPTSRRRVTMMPLNGAQSGGTQFFDKVLVSKKKRVQKLVFRVHSINEIIALSQAQHAYF